MTVMTNIQRTSVASAASMASEGASNYVQLGALRFHYVEWGPRDAPVLLCLHGLRSYARTFQALATVLQRDFRVIALDQRGRGQTDWDPRREYYAARYAADIEAFVDALGIERLHMLGHSMGGINALVYSLANGHRLSSLVLEDSGPGASRNSGGATRIDAELANTPESFPDWGAARAFWRSIRPNVTEAAIESRVANSLRQTDAGVAWIHDQAGITQCRLHPAQPDPDLWPCVRQLACPTLLVRGERSDYLSRETFEAMRAASTHIAGVEVEGAGHYVHDDNPARFHAVVSAFLGPLRD